MWLQDAEETSCFAEKLVEIDWFGHEDVCARVENFFFVVALAADCDDRCAVGVVRFDAAAYFGAINPGYHNVQDQEVRFYTAYLDESCDAVGCRGDLITPLAFEEGLYHLGDLLFVFHDQHVEFSLHQCRRSRDLVLAKERQKVFFPDAAVPPRCPV